MANKFLTSGEQSDIFDDPALTRQKLGIIYGPGGTTQSYDNTLNSLANLSTTAGKIIKCDGSDSFTTIPITTEGESLINGTATIPSNTSDLTNDSGFITSSSIPTSLSSFTNDTNFITSSSIPTTLSTFTNDTNYITSSGVPTALSSFTNDTNYITLSTAGTMTNKSIEVDVDSSKTLSFMKSAGLAPVKTILVSQNHNNTSTGDKTIFLPAINFGLSNDTLVGQTTTATLINKTIDYNNNTITNLPSSGIQSGDNISLLNNNEGYITNSALSNYIQFTTISGWDNIFGAYVFTHTDYTNYNPSLNTLSGRAYLFYGDNNTFSLNDRAADVFSFTTDRALIEFNDNTKFTNKVSVGGLINNSYNLQVYGDINFTGNLYQNGSAFSSGSSQWTTSSSDIYYNSGNVGIGTDSPEAQLQINQSVAFTNPYQETSQTSAIHLVPHSASSHSAITFAFANNNKRGVGAICGSSSYGLEFIVNRSRHHYFYGSTTNVTLPATTTNDLIMIMRGDNKRVGIGTNSPNDTLDVKGTIRVTGGSPDYLRIRLSNTFSVGEATNDSVPGVVGNNFPNGSAIIEYTGGQSTTNNEGAYIWLNGDTIGIMNTGDSNAFHWYDSDVFPSASSGQHWYISTSGSITNSSDLTLKNNIRYFDDEYDISNSKHKYSQIKFCKYQWKKELKDPSGVKEDFYGVIAQEIEPLFPEMVETDEGGLKMIKQERLQYISYFMIANLIKENDILKAELQSIKTHLNLN